MPEQAEPWSRARLPRPFADDPWKDERAESANVLWDWHQGLLPELAGLDARRRAALEVCSRYELDPDDVGLQEEAAERMRDGLRLPDAEALNALVHGWTAAHGRLLAGLAGLGKYSWQQTYIFMMSRGFTLSAALMVLPEDLAEDRILFPLSDLEQAGLTPEELKNDGPTRAAKKVIWKEVVRARDSFAQAQQLVDDLDRRQAASFRRWWFAGLEILHIIESNDYDVWNRPPRLTRYRRLHTRFQARFGRTTFR